MSTKGMNAADPRYRVGFDIGGTFTDFVLVDGATGALFLHKRLTTPHDPSEAALIGLKEIAAMAGLTLSDVAEIVHGTTLVTNAVIERKGARTGLITTQGFRDLLEMGAEQRYDIYDLRLSFPDPLVERSLRMEVQERVDALGRVVTALDEAETRKTIRTLADTGCAAIAVAFLHSYANPAHERRVREIAADEAPGLSISLSSDVVAALGEYPRIVTTVANAYVQPLIDRYLARLEAELKKHGFAGSLRLMHSGGGLVSPLTARQYPIRLLESGPAGGALATALFGARAGLSDVLSFDMGGTTAKACLVENGRAEIATSMEAGRVHRFKKGSGLPIKAPVVDMIEIGAGGGSIAALDEVGLLRVGPHSSGADPGPACYGRGGKQATVTDANLVLGYYDPGFFLGGRMSLDVAAARAVMETLSTPLGLTIEATAAGIHDVVTESMADAARVHLVEKGKDPRDFAMVGFGGAGPAHAVGVARALGVRQVLVPPASGAASALGFLAAPLSFEGVRSHLVRFTADFDEKGVLAVLSELESEGRARLIEAGVSAGDVRFEHAADMRLVGQMHDIRVALPADAFTTRGLAALREAFVATYTARFTSVPPGAAFEAMTFRVTALGPTPVLQLAGSSQMTAGASPLKGHRTAWFQHKTFDTPVYDRYALDSNTAITGPAIIEEREATTVIGPGDRLSVDAAGNLVIDVALADAPAARITAQTPLEDAIALIEADPIALEIMWSRLVNVVEEMWLTVCRTAFSLVISEAQDFACELLDPDGEPLAHSPRAMPVFNLTLPRAVKALLAKHPAETLKPGDVLVTNDPWLCAGHLFDIAIVTPVFREGRVVALMGTVGHVSDIGGTRDWLAAREIYEEGLQIPPMKLIREGVRDETFYSLFAENVRNPAQVIGDIESFVAANATGAERLTAFMRDYGMHDLRALAAVVQNRAEKAMRDAIRALPDGVYHGEATANPMGTPYRFPLELTVRDDRIVLDFAGAPPQLGRGGFNCTLNYTEAHATYPLKCMLTPNVRGNAGCYRAFEVRAPEGSMLNAQKPVAVNLRTRTGWYLAPSIFRALSPAAPQQVQSFTGLPVSCNLYGRDSAGQSFSDLLFTGGGQGASFGRDGISGLLYPTSAANTSVEMFEARVPALVLEKAYITDSGGAGESRGGLGQRVRLRKRDADAGVLNCAVYPEGAANPFDGLYGGKAGGMARGLVIGPDPGQVHDVGTGELVELSRPDQIIDVMLAGGSGFGNPSARERAKLERDVALGYVSPAGALRDYGVALSDITKTAPNSGSSQGQKTRAEHNN
jgi:5-oxoprolinase (ATP-hydrolysing)